MLIGPNSNVAQKAKIVGNTLMLLGQNGKWATAPEGTYRAMDGGSKEIIVQRGVIVPGIVSPENAPVPMRREKNVPPPKEGTAGDALRRGMQQAR
ncbi:MAG: hypothetical protein M5R38_17140 [Candidatus Methylomirabilis sp.]|nr:hypothetical protein [Candidatus Methylomirabilis sp.]